MNLPELVSSAIESAIASQRPLSWKVQESNKGTLIQLVWKSPTSSCVRVRSRPTERVRSKWNPPASQPHNNKISKKSPSRIRRNAKRLQTFLEKKERTELNSKDSLDDCQQPGSPVVCVANSLKIVPSPSATVSAEVSVSTPTENEKIEPLKLGEVSWLSDHPGSFVRNEGKKGETVFWSKNPYTDTIIPVLHHGAIGYMELTNVHAAPMLMAGMIALSGLVQFVRRRRKLNAIPNGNT